MSDEYLDKVKENISNEETILTYLPFFRGYKEKELRRETDILIRQKAAQYLKSGTKLLKDGYNNVVKSGLYDEYKRYENIIFKLDSLRQKVTHAVLGYGGLFGSIKIKEKELDKLLEYDILLINKSSEIKQLVKDFNNNVQGDAHDENTKLYTIILKNIIELEDLFNNRSNLIIGVD